MPTLSNVIWDALIENTPFVRHKYFYIAGKRPASLVLPTAPRRPTRGGHQAGWATMPGGTRARRQQQNRQVRYDLHLPSMPNLTCKTSSQALLLRVLKVILQLREAARKSASGATSSRTRTSHRRGELELDLQFYVAEYANCFYSRVH